jgi:hypothetical protein
MNPTPVRHDMTKYHFISGKTTLEKKRLVIEVRQQHSKFVHVCVCVCKLNNSPSHVQNRDTNLCQLHCTRWVVAVLSTRPGQCYVGRPAYFPAPAGALVKWGKMCDSQWRRIEHVSSFALRTLYIQVHNTFITGLFIICDYVFRPSAEIRQFRIKYRIFPYRSKSTKRTVSKIIIL